MKVRKVMRMKKIDVEKEEISIFIKLIKICLEELLILYKMINKRKMILRKNKLINNNNNVYKLRYLIILKIKT